MKNRTELSSSSGSNHSNSSTSSNPLSTVLSEMYGNAITNGWDAVCAISIDKANELFALRFADILKSGLNNGSWQPFTGISPDSTIIFKNILLSAPLIKININSSLNSLNLSFLVLAGTIINTSTNNIGSIGTVNNITPDLNIQFTAEVPVSALSASTTNGTVNLDVSSANFSFSSSPNNGNVIYDLQIEQTIQQLMSVMIQGSSFSQSFPIATLPTGSDNSNALMPIGTISFATQQTSNTNDTGRLLIFMPTNFNPNGGSQNYLSNVSNIIPDNVTDGNGNVVDNALIISADVFMRSMVASLTTTLTTSENNNIAFDNSNINNNGTIPSATTNYGTLSINSNPSCWQDPITHDQFVGFIATSIGWDKVMTISFVTPDSESSGNYQINFSSSSSQVFQSYFNGDPAGMQCSTTNLGDSSRGYHGTLNIWGSGNIVPSIETSQTSNNSITFSWGGNVNSSFSFNKNLYYYLGIYPWLDSDTIGNNLSAPLQNLIDPAITSGMPSINTFVLENFLFSTESTIQMQAAYLPGDIAIFGTTQMPNWYLSASNVTLDIPISVVPAGSTITLSSNGSGIPQQVNWTNSSSIGTLTTESNMGATYTSPTTVTTAQVVIINASDSSDSSSTTAFPLVIVPNVLNISPNLAVLENTAGKGQCFTSTALSSDVLNWSSSNPNAYISFSTNNSVSSTVATGNGGDAQFTTITLTDNTNNMTGSAYILTIPNLSPSLMMDNIVSYGTPGELITVNATVNTNFHPPVTGVNSWQLFDENNVSGLTLSGTGMSNSFTIDTNATLGSVIFIVANGTSNSLPSAITAVIVSDISNNSDYLYHNHNNDYDIDLSGINMFDIY